MKQKGTLTFFCGKMGAGKTTKSKTISIEKNAVLLSEDDWLEAHYPDQINSFDDFIHFSAIVKPFVKLHVQQILNTGTNVVMDFPANTTKQREWFRQLCDETACDHELIFIDLSDEQCLAHIAIRNEEHPERAHFDNEDMYNLVTKYFEAPSESENFNVTKYDKCKP